MTSPIRNLSVSIKYIAHETGGVLIEIPGEKCQFRWNKIASTYSCVQLHFSSLGRLTIWFKNIFDQ